MENNNELEYIINSIKIIEKQISDFEKCKPLFFRKYKLNVYKKRIKELEGVRRYLYKRIEYMLR